MKNQLEKIFFVGIVKRNVFEAEQANGDDPKHQRDFKPDGKMKKLLFLPEITRKQLNGNVITLPILKKVLKTTSNCFSNIFVSFSPTE